MRFCFGAQIASAFSCLLYICFRTSSHALQRAVFMPLGCSVPTGTQKSRHAGACRLTACDNDLPPQELTCGGLIRVQVSSASGCSSSSSWGDDSLASSSGGSVTGSVRSTISSASAVSSARMMMSIRKSFFLMPRSLR